MRTVFVNPSRPRRRRKSRGTQALTLRRSAAPARRRRRRNAGITPFVASSNSKLIWPNPKGSAVVRRRRKRSNPSTALGKVTVKNVLGTALSSAGGAGLAVAVDVFGTSKIQNVWGRNGSRLAAALGSAALIPGQFGAAGAGAMLFPVMKEIAEYFLNSDETDAPTEADLDLLSQDLGAMIDPNDLKPW